MRTKVREAVLNRDRRCMAQQWQPHQCRTTDGRPHPATDVRLLTMEHVVEVDRKSLQKKPPDDLLHMVAVCGYANVVLCHASSWKQWARRYLGQ